MNARLAEPPAKFRHSIRVRYAECDAQGIVFNAHYLNYFDVAMTEFWRELLAGGYGEITDAGHDMVVAEARARYLSPARFDEELDIAVTPSHIGTTSLAVELKVTRDERALVEGHLRYVFVDLKTTRTRPISEEIRAAVARTMPRTVSS
jgi:acyl-CoA thioester hydrolase